MPKYNTQQGNFVMEYMQSRPGDHVTVNDIMFHFQQENIDLGLTTIYRHLNRMVDQGLVKKFFIDDKSAACFEYIANDNQNKHHQFHLMCSECNQLIHFECLEISDWQEHIKEEHGFQIDPERTVFYGLCKQCLGEVK